MAVPFTHGTFECALDSSIMPLIRRDQVSRIGLLVCVNVRGTYKLIFCAGFNVETVEYKNISFTVWDVGGQDKVWFIYFPCCVPTP